jgi:predicted nuclease of predicted toxin-antitoxin system
MPRTIRFHLDESCDPRIAAGLRLHGIDVTTSNEAGLLNTPDAVQIAFAIAQNRVTITQDTDFLRIAASGQEHSGIVYFAAQSRSVGEVIRRIQLIWEVYEAEEMRTRVEFV